MKQLQEYLVAPLKIVSLEIFKRGIVFTGNIELVPSRLKSFFVLEHSRIRSRTIKAKFVIVEGR